MIELYLYCYILFNMKKFSRIKIHIISKIYYIVLQYIKLLEYT